MVAPEKHRIGIVGAKFDQRVNDHWSVLAAVDIVAYEDHLIEIRKRNIPEMIQYGGQQVVLAMYISYCVDQCGPASTETPELAQIAQTIFSISMALQPFVR